jgi:5-methylcytosine-specific restriction protein A
MKYYYAYHSPKNKNDFEWDSGYGLTDKKKRDAVMIGSQVIVIQKPKGAGNFRLCGVFKVVAHYEDMENIFPFRFELENVTKLSKFPILDDKAIGLELPKKTGGNIGWSNFQKHFCSQGITFQKHLEPAVAEVLLGYLDSPILSLEDISESFNKEVLNSTRSSSEERRKRLKLANPKPKRRIVTTTAFDRNPDVVAEVLHRAKGKCEKCPSFAPFLRKSDGSPYLEVHHRKPLAKGGLDTVENAIALCPNCHREAHYGYKSFKRDKK